MRAYREQVHILEEGEDVGHVVVAMKSSFIPLGSLSLAHTISINITTCEISHLINYTKCGFACKLS